MSTKDKKNTKGNPKRAKEKMASRNPDFPKIREEKGKSRQQPYDPELSEDDLQAIRSKGNSMNPGADSQLERRGAPVDFTADDLDIPGRKSGRTPQGGKMTDEENKHFSQGGPENEGLEERKDSDQPAE